MVPSWLEPRNWLRSFVATQIFDGSRLSKAPVLGTRAAQEKKKYMGEVSCRFVGNCAWLVWGHF